MQRLNEASLEALIVDRQLDLYGAERFLAARATN